MKFSFLVSEPALAIIQSEPFPLLLLAQTAAKLLADLTNAVVTAVDTSHSTSKCSDRRTLRLFHEGTLFRVSTALFFAMAHPQREPYCRWT